MYQGDICHTQVRTAGTRLRRSADPSLSTEADLCSGGRASRSPSSADRGSMSSQTILNLVIGIAIAGLLIYRQLRARPVRGSQRLVFVLALIGLIEIVPYLRQPHADAPVVIALAGQPAA